MLLLFQLLFNLPHLFSYTLIWAHSKALAQQLYTKHCKQNGGGQVGKSLGDECRYGVTQHGG
jgi:hypothetical protein